MIDELRDHAVVDLPFVVGDGANERLGEFRALLDAARGAARPRSTPACLVGGAPLEPQDEVRPRRETAGDRSAVGRGDAGRLCNANPASSSATSCCARSPHAGPRLRAALRDAAPRAPRRARQEGRRAMSSSRSRRACGQMSAAQERRALRPRRRRVEDRLPDRSADADGAPPRLLRGRTHRCKVLGIGHQRSRGVKAGAIVDLDAAENAIRLAVDAAERMAGVEVESVIVNMSGGRLSSQLFDAKIAARRQGRSANMKCIAFSRPPRRASACAGPRRPSCRADRIIGSTPSAASTIPRA